MVSTCIVGAGVAGLTCASVLHRAGVPVRVLESGDRPGGRVRSARDATGRHLGDLGPSWVWPPFQPLLAGWLERLAVPTMVQYETGDGCVERATGGPVVRTALPGQPGQRRPCGGPQAIIDALLATLPHGTVRTGCRVTAIDHRDGRPRLTLRGGETLEATSVVLAAPLRVVARDIAFEPPLPPAIRRSCEEAPTWMAAQAKALAIYPTPFWRARGLSGRLSSTIGPLVESHDHSGPDGEPAALVGFVGLDARARDRLAREHGAEALVEAVRAQLVRCFGDEARAPLTLRIEDWAHDPHVATALDIERPGGHPAVLPDALREPLPGGGPRFAVAEVAALSPGLLEGAFAAGEHAARRLLADRASGTAV